MSSETGKSAADYLEMAEELEAMAASIARDPRLNHHFAQRLNLLARQMREDSAGFPANGAQPG